MTAPTDPISDSYPDLIDRFGREKFTKRLEFLLGRAEQIISNRGAGDFARVSPKLMRDALLDYAADIERLKDFHGIERTNPFKVAAYTTYWLLRRKPIQIVTDPDDGQEIRDLNEWFAVSIFISMAYDTRHPNIQAAEEKSDFNTFLRSLHYGMVYRILNPQALELTHLALAVSPPYDVLGKDTH